MAFSRLSSLSLLAFACAFSPLTVQAQVLTDYTQTPDQTLVGGVFDTYGQAAASGSALEADYNRLFVGTGEAASTQSMLPTTAYNLRGAANALASNEEGALSARLRTLREGHRLTPRRVATASAARIAPFTDLQDSHDSLHDLRVQPKATGESTAQYPLYSPAVYQDPIPPKPADTWAERQYDEAMRKIAIGAGAANATTRDTKTVRQRILLNQADRTGRDIISWAGQVGGSGHAFDTAKGDMPRRTLQTLKEKQKAAIRAYPGQPLSGIVNTPALQAAPPAPAPQAAPPVVYSAGEEPVGYPAPRANAPKPAAPQAAPTAVYEDIDQDDALTTPKKGSSVSLRFKQVNNFALVAQEAEDGTLKKKLNVPPRESSDVGTLLWVSDAASVEGPSPSHAKAIEPISEPEPSHSIAMPLEDSRALNADRRFGSFFSGSTGYGHNEHQKDSAKAKTVRIGFTAGVDYRLQEQSYVGLALTYAHSSFTTGSLGDLQGDSIALSLYGTTDYADSAYVDGYISIGYHSLDSQRTILAGDSTTRKATASPNGLHFAGKAETGYDFKSDDLKYGPYAGFRLAYADFGSFTESGAGTFDLKVKEANTLSAISSLGVGGSLPFSLSNGGVLLPALRVGYNHEFGDDSSTVKAEFANLAGSGFTTKGAKISRDWVNITPSITAALANDWTFAAHYEHDFFRDDSAENIFNLAARYAW